MPTYNNGYVNEFSFDIVYIGSYVVETQYNIIYIIGRWVCVGISYASIYGLEY
jgi:hypothetical protein